MSGDGSPCFPPSVHERLQAMDFGRWGVVAEEAYAGLIDRRIDSVSYGDLDTISNEARALANCKAAQQMFLHRAERLMVSSGTMVLEENSYGLNLLIRGHLEGLAALGYLCNRVQSFVDGNITFETVFMDIATLVMGAQHEVYKDAPPPINVMTQIQKADRFIEKQWKGAEKGILMESYKWLSEFAHPNFGSNNQAVVCDGPRIAFRHGIALTKQELSQFGYLALNAPMFPWMFDALSNLAEQAFGEGKA